MVKAICSYTSFLICDFIHSAQNKELEVNLKPINFFQILQFCQIVTNALIKSSGNENVICQLSYMKNILDPSLNINSFFPIKEFEKMFVVISDEVRLKQLFLNFLSNAVKFTKYGNITIDISFNHNNTNQSYSVKKCQTENLSLSKNNKTDIIITITDTGMGLNEEQLEKIRLKKSSELVVNRIINSMGTSLGISICHGILEKLDYDMEINSKLNEGTSIKIILKNVIKKRNEFSINEESSDADLVEVEEKVCNKKTNSFKFNIIGPCKTGSFNKNNYNLNNDKFVFELDHKSCLPKTKRKLSGIISNKLLKIKEKYDYTSPIKESQSFNNDDDSKIKTNMTFFQKKPSSMNINKNKKLTNISYFVDRSNQEIVKIINKTQNKEDINNNNDCYNECYSSNDSEKDEKLTQTMSNVNKLIKNNKSINNQSSSKEESAIHKDKRSAKSIESLKKTYAFAVDIDKDTEEINNIKENNIATKLKEANQKDYIIKTASSFPFNSTNLEENRLMTPPPKKLTKLNEKSNLVLTPNKRSSRKYDMISRSHYIKEEKNHFTYSNNDNKEEDASLVKSNIQSKSFIVNKNSSSVSFFQSKYENINSGRNLALDKHALKRLSNTKTSLKSTELVFFENKIVPLDCITNIDKSQIKFSNKDNILNDDNENFSETVDEFYKDDKRINSTVKLDNNKNDNLNNFSITITDKKDNNDSINNDEDIYLNKPSLKDLILKINSNVNINLCQKDDMNISDNHSAYIKKTTNFLANNENKQLKKNTNFQFSKQSPLVKHKTIQPHQEDSIVILVVDDNKFIRDALKNQILKSINTNGVKGEIIGCSDGIDIIQQIISDQKYGNRIKCVFTDECMEYMNGSEAVTKLKDFERQRKLKNLPKLVLVTAHTDDNITDSLKALGFDYVLQKSPQVNQIEQALRLLKILK